MRACEALTVCEEIVRVCERERANVCVWILCVSPTGVGTYLNVCVRERLGALGPGEWVLPRFPCPAGTGCIGRACVRERANDCA